MTMAVVRAESLARAVEGQSLANYPAIIQGFSAMGIPEDQINPRENVFTFHAWKALGRSVKKGEHGVKVFTYAESTKENKETGKVEKVRRPWSTTVFHVTQTEPSEGREAKAPAPARQVVATAPRGAGSAQIAERFRGWADSLQPKIDHASRPMTQNPTPKRNREYQSRLHDARNMERTQRALRALAGHHDAGTIPAELAELKTRDDISRLVRKCVSGRGGYYAVIEENGYAETTPAARMLQGMMENNPQHAARERERAYGELMAEIALRDFPGYFPTPETTADEVAELADIQPGQRICEPSAGTGNLVRAILNVCADVEVVAIEQQPKLAEALRYIDGVDVIEDDFLELPPIALGSFDRIVMNPPFEKAADIEHITAALSFLKPGGRLVAICCNGPRQNEQLRPMVEEYGGTWQVLPSGTFKHSGTNVTTVLLSLTMPLQSSKFGAN